MSTADSLEKPYIKAGVAKGAIGDVVPSLRASMAASGFQLLGEYSPAGAAKRRVLCYTSPELTTAADESGGLHGLAAVLRVGVDEAESGDCTVSATNPSYWGPAMHAEKWTESLRKTYHGVEEQLSAVFKGAGLGAQKPEAFGGAAYNTYTLMWYRYAFGMERFSHPVQCGTFTSHEEGVKKITENLANNPDGHKLVYAHKVSNTVRIFGVALNGSTGEANFLPTIDCGPDMHTPAFPYELALVDKNAFTLHGRYRIALAFPGTTLSQFMQIVNTPPAIEAAMKALCQ